MAIASADLAGVWSLDEVVERLTALADASVRAALRVALRAAGLSETLEGLFVLAMGKMGARELNYSSDVDL